MLEEGLLPRIGITGHSNLSGPSELLVLEELRGELGKWSPDELVGVTCLARGADQLFARAVRECGGGLDVVLPAEDYRERKVKPDNLATFDALIDEADSVVTMGFAESGRHAYLSASEHVLDNVDQVVAVWDGKSSGGQGGTADVVETARTRGLPVTVVWPRDAVRE